MYGIARYESPRFTREGRYPGMYARRTGFRPPVLPSDVPGGVLDVSAPYGHRDPIPGVGLTSAHKHAGLDIALPTGTPLVAPRDAYAYVFEDGVCGKGVSFTPGTTFEEASAAEYRLAYCHLSGFAISGHQFVRRGQVVGYVGSTGASTGPHLHITLTKLAADDKWYSVDPVPFIRWSPFRLRWRDPSRRGRLILHPVAVTLGSVAILAAGGWYAHQRGLLRRWS